ncbi:MAG: sulfatase [Bryobacterales bacterium]|nr:sulfatase [Bryobacterales bacterium]
MTTLLRTVGLAVMATAAAAPAPPPNVIVVLVDDLGWMDLGCQGSDFYQTPNIDRLAASGMRFTDGYASCAVCSPTRAALMTGRAPARLGITDWIRAEFQLANRQWPNIRNMFGYHRPAAADRPLLTPVNELRLPHREITLAELLKPLGYTSAYIGKWHLGGRGHLPTDQGFDENYGGWDYGQPPSYFDPYVESPRLPMGIPTLTPREPGEYLTDREADEAVAFIDRNRDRPFLLYLAHYAVHTPIQAKEGLIESYRAAQDGKGQDDPVYAAMVHSVDDAMGRLLDALQRNGLADRTIIVFTGDNGGLDRNGRPTENDPLRSGKGYAYEGGLRTPWIVSWPGVTTPGSVSAEPMASIDLLPTIAAAVGTRPPVDRPIDGVDLSPVLRGGSLDERALVWHFPHYRHGPGHDPYSVIRKGDWKLIRFYDPPKVELYDLSRDLGESRDLATAETGRTRELQDLLDERLNRVGARMPRRPE